MDAFFDMLWFKILIGVQHLKSLMDIIVSPLNALGPAVAIFAIAFAAVLVKRVYRVTGTDDSDALRTTDS